MKTILIVEDDVDTLAMMSETLKEEGYHVLEASNGRQGLAALALVHADLIVCDVMMPHLDGRKMCHIVRANPAYESIPILMVSAADDSIRRQFSNIIFLKKPFSIDSFLQGVEQLLYQPTAA